MMSKDLKFPFQKLQQLTYGRTFAARVLSINYVGHLIVTLEVMNESQFIVPS